MSISNRRTGKIGPPPGSYDTEWLNRLRILLEELAGRLVPADYLGHSQWGWRGQDPGDVELQDYDTPFRILAANTSIDESPNQMTVRYSWEQILTPHDQRNIIRDNAQENDGPYPVVMVYLGDIGTDPIDSQYDESGAWRYKGIKSGDGVVTISESDDYIELSAPGAVPTSRSINTTSPLNGGGFLSSNLTLSLAGLGNVGTALYYTRTNAAGTAWEYRSPSQTRSDLGVTVYDAETTQDVVGAMVANGTGLSWSYNDGAGTLTGTVSLSSFSTSNLAEGTNLYYTDERVDDRVSSLLTAGTGISLSYNDPANTLTIASTLSAPSALPVPLDEGGTGSDLSSTGPGVWVQQTTGAQVTVINPTSPIELAGGALRLNASAADRYLYSTSADTWTEGTISSFARTLLDDADAAAARTTLGITAYDAETVQDLVGAMVTDSTTIDATYSDAAGTVTLERAALTGDVTASAGSNATTIGSDTVTYAKMQNVSAASRILGRGSDAGAGDPQELTVGASLAISGTVVQRAALTGDVTASADSNATTIANNAVTLAKMADLATDRLLGRDTAGTGDPEALTVGGGLEFTGSGGIQRSALTGDVTASAGSGATTIANDAVTFAKLQNVATDTLLGRFSASTGDVEAVTCTDFAQSLLDDSDAATARTTLGAAAASHTHTSTDITNFSEAVDDRVAALLVEGTNITLTYDDVSNTLTIDAAGGGSGYTDEEAQDAVGSILVDSATIDFTYSDATPSITASVVAGSIGTTQLADDGTTFAKLQNIATDRLLGRDTASSGNVEELTVGGGLEFTGSGGVQRSALTGDVTASAGSGSTTIASGVVSLAKMADIATDRLIGRDTAGTGVPEALTVGGGIEFTGSGGIQTSALTGDVTKTAGGTATTIAALAVSTSKLADGAVTFAKMQDVDDDVVLGRATTGSGDIEEIPCTPFARSLLACANAGTALSTIGAAAGSHSHTVWGDLPLVAPTRLLGRYSAISGSVEEIQLAAQFFFDSGIFSLVDDSIPLGKLENVVQTQLDAAVNLLSAGRLEYQSATQLRLNAWAGQYLDVGGEIQTVDGSTAGCQLAPTDNLISSSGTDAGAAMAANTTYYVYRSNSTASFAASDLRASATAPTDFRGDKYLAASGNGAKWRYVGMLRTNGSTQFSNSLLVVSWLNRRLRRAIGKDTTDSWAYTTGSWRGANNGNSNWKIEFLSNGVDVVRATAKGAISSTSGYARWALGLSSTSAPDTDCLWESGGWANGPVDAFYCGVPGQGYQYLQALEYGTTGGTFYGDNGATLQGGILVEVMG